MKELFIWFVVLVGMILGAAWLQKGGFSLTQTSSPKIVEPKLMKIGETSIEVEIADLPEEHEKGLSGRDSLDADKGMLFIMTKDSAPTFWMKDMRFALDIIWINDNEIVDIAESIPNPNPETPENELPRYRSQRPADYILEVNEGFTKEHGIEIGNKVKLPEGI